MRKKDFPRFFAPRKGFLRRSRGRAETAFKGFFGILLDFFSKKEYPFYGDRLEKSFLFRKIWISAFSAITIIASLIDPEV